MKTVFSNREVPHIWAQQTQESGRGSNIFFDGATIYSYGRHFPIATIEGMYVLFTLRSYSNTTAKHISRTRQAISHKEIIYCYEVPVKNSTSVPLRKMSFHEHSINFDTWRKAIEGLISELGNKKNRDVSGRINTIQLHVDRLNKYAEFFDIKIPADLQKVLKLVNDPEFVDKAREAKAKLDKASELKLKKAAKAYDQYIALWRAGNEEGIKEMPQPVKELCNYYIQQSASFTRLRFNAAQNRLETSKGIQIPVEIAKRAYVQLNGCMEGECDGISIPVMNYTITETGKDYIKAGCHTIPKSDVKYIAQLLNWD